MTKQQKKWLIRAIGVVVVGILAMAALQRYGINRKDQGIVGSNGRIEATEIDVAAKTAGRIKEILVREGDFVKAGQVAALMDTEVLEAQLREAKAKLQQAQADVAIASSQLVQRQSEKAAALAVVVQREAELDVARKSLARSSTLAAEGAASHQQEDDDAARVQSAAASLKAANAQVAAAEAAIVTAREQVAGAKSAVEAVRATTERIQADIKDSALKSPRDGRVQYKVAQPGEVVGAGGRVLSLVDLSDVYMTFFVSTEAAGRVTLGAEVRVVLDAAPQYVFPLKVSFVDNVAQFTPKTVETASEREKLMFRVRAHFAEDELKKHITHVKTGLPGMAYVKLDPAMQWPAHLQVKLPND
jgi:HlyD family secretion protein